MQRTPIGQAMIMYWETEDPQRMLREIANSQDEVVKQFRELIFSAAPGLDLSQEQPLPNELLFSWQASSVFREFSTSEARFPRRPFLSVVQLIEVTYSLALGATKY